MSKQGESNLSRTIVNALNARGHFVWKNHGDAFSRRGISDITGVTFGGRIVALETKREGSRDTLSPAQRQFLCKIRKGDGIAGVVSSVGEAIAIVENGLVQSELSWIAKRKDKRSDARRSAELDPW